MALPRSTSRPQEDLSAMQTEDHPIHIEPAGGRWRAMFHDGVIADSAGALLVREPGAEAQVYFPRDDVAMEYMSPGIPGEASTRLGQATWFTLKRHSAIVEHAAWSYEDADSARQLSGYVAFDPRHVEIYQVDEDRVDPHHRHAEPRAIRSEVDEVVQHTDTGAGQTQREHWPSNVEGPAPREGGVS
jgi:uncharacterized protein (DUF427 family)